MAGEEPPVLPSELKSKSKLLNLSDETAPRRELGKPKKLAQPKQ
jgi:hypothetical protein